MEFMNRGNAQHPGATAAPSGAPQQPHTNKPKKNRMDKTFGLRVVSVILLFSVTVLLVALAASFVFGPKDENSYVDNERLQAVFLNGGQVYFGKVTDLNDKYLRMEDIFYLRVNQTVQPNQQGNQQAAQNDIQLVKLGCELHRPQNEMLINRSQVVFWENLKDETGENTVPGAVKNYKTQYPNGQECQAVNDGGGSDAGAGAGAAGSTAPTGSDIGSDTVDNATQPSLGN